MVSKIARLVRQSLTPIKTIDDEFLSWVSFANAGMLHKGNVYLMQYAIRNLPSSAPIIEIGSFCGLSTNVMGYLLAAESRSNTIVCSDKWVFEGSESGRLGKSDLSASAYREFVKASFVRNVNFFSAGRLPFAIEALSDEFFELWGSGRSVPDTLGRQIKLGGPVSFCYIDGNHTYPFAKRDFLNVDGFLEVGGFVLFDDSADNNRFGLTKLMQEVQRNPRYKLVLKNPNYLFQKIS